MVSAPSLPDDRCFVGVDIAAASFTALWLADGRALSRAVTFSQSPPVLLLSTANSRLAVASLPGP